MTQRQSNPFGESDTNKRYYTYDRWLKQTFGEKCAKIPLDMGLTCPNIDGKCGTGGCIYCSGRGSGDFASSSTLSLCEQFEEQKRLLGHKWATGKYIAYFQAHSNTYAPLSFLKPRFDEVLTVPGCVGMNIATRADCLEDDTVAYLAKLAEETVLTVELGLQTSSDETAKRIHRGHTYSDFCRGFHKLRAASDRICICVHLIFGLPGEDENTMLSTVRDLAVLHPDQVKIHLLHVLAGTELAKSFLSGEYQPPEREDYIRTVAEALTLLPPDTVVARLTGDGKADDLLAPLYSRNKLSILNDIDKYLFEHDLWQGKRYVSLAENGEL